MTCSVWEVGFGGLIQTAAGNWAGTDRPFTKRSGLCVGLLHGHLALSQRCFGPSVVHIGWCQNPNSAMMMLIVVPAEEVLRPISRIWQRAKASWISRVILECLELRFRVRIIVRDMGSGMALAHTQIGHQSATGLAVMAPPRSAWMVNCPGWMPCLTHVSAISSSASSASSLSAIIQPTK